MGIVVTVLLGVLACEVYAWLPRVADALLAWAVSRLNAESRERYREEWQAHLSDRPNITRVIEAVSLHWATRSINKSTLVAAYEDTGEKLENLSMEIARSRRKLLAARSQLEESRRDSTLQIMKDSISLNQKSAHPLVSEAIGALCQYGDTLIRAQKRLFEITEEKITVFDASLQLASHHLERATELYSQIEPRRLRTTKAPEILKTAEKALASALAEIQSVDGKTNLLDQQWNNIVTAIGAPRTALLQG